MALLERGKINQLLQVLKQENARSLHLSCLPGDFSRSRNKLDIARIEKFDPGFPKKLGSALLNGSAISYSPNQEDPDLVTDELKVRKKLSHLLDECTAEEKERGYNPLRIGFPILVQENNSASTQCFSAPLFVWDIEIKEERGGNWKFIPSKEVPKPNVSLEGMVTAGTTELDLEPLYGGSWEEGSLAEFAAQLDGRLQAFLDRNEKVRFKQTDQGLCPIPFTKKQDLVTSKAMPFILTLFDSMLLGKFHEGKVSIIRDLEAHGDSLEDLTESPLDTPAIGANLADPSQAGAIADLKEGKHIVLHGPPGTGKSQTITGVITSAVASGYRVAVVCQKLAALEVIQANLKELGHENGVAMITNISKDRRKIVDEVRAREEEGPNWTERPKKVSTTKYESAGQKIERAKQRANEDLLGGQRFQDLVGRVGRIRRELEGAGMKMALRKKPSEAQLNDWKRDLPGTLRQIQTLSEEQEQIAPALPLRDLVNEKVNQASIGVDIDLIQEQIHHHDGLQTQLQEQRTALSAALNEAYQNQALEMQRAQALWQSLQTSIQSLPRPIQIQINHSLGDELKASEERFERVKTLEKERYAIERESQYQTYTSTKGFQAWLKRCFSSEFKAMHKQWTDHESRLKAEGFIASDPLGDMLVHLKQLNDSLREAQNALSEIIGWTTESSPSQVLSEWTARIKGLKKAAENPISSPPQDGFAEATEELIQLQAKCEGLKTELTAIPWLSAEGVEKLASHSGKEAHALLAAQGPKLAAMGNWLKACEATKLELTDFDGQPAHWVEYHTLSHLVGQWSGVEDLMTSDGPIDSVAREVESLRQRINLCIGEMLDHEFNTGAQQISTDHRVHSFKQEFIKTGKRKKTLRQLYHRHSETMTRLFPIHLTTPEVLCNLFEGRDRCFDLVIFDEASQVELHDAVTCLLKGTSIVVAGDEHQMPPSHYFASRTDHLYDEDDDEVEGAIIEVESLLEFCQQHPGFSSRYLDFHYRSHHPLLIQFSNQAIYSRLVVRPNPTEYTPIQFIDVQGVWDNQHNSKEAERAIDLLQTLSYSDLNPPKVLVATMNVRQRTEIVRMIKAVETDDPKFQRRMDTLRSAGFGVKNLENLQGDECDVLMISIGYGAKSNGNFSRNYGIINQKHGYRLLNVLITRARYKVFLLNSIPPNAHKQFDSELAIGGGKWNRGLLHAYVNYAEAVSTGNAERVGHILDALKRHSLGQQFSEAPAGGLLESPFEEEVFEALRAHFTEDEIQLQEPHMGFRMDMVVRPKAKPGLKIAIECDGATYHSGWQNQLADHHREKLLRGAGYEFVRVWSRSWWSDSKQSGRDVLNRINTIVREWNPSELKGQPPTWCTPLDTERYPTLKRGAIIIESDSDPIAPKQASKSPLITDRQKPPQSTPSAAQPNPSIGKPDKLHVLAPCMAIVKVVSANLTGLTIKYIFLESSGRSFLGRSREEWGKLGEGESIVKVWGDESIMYKAFEGKESGEIVEVNGRLFQVESIELDD